MKKQLPECPICGQEMDFCATTYRTHPFIDGNVYKKMCFTCANIPDDLVQTYDANGNIVSEEGPFFDWKHLRSPEDLVHIGSAESLEQAGRCLRAVRRKLKEIGAVALNKLKLRRPSPEYVDLTYGEDDDDEQAIKVEKKRKKRRQTVETVEKPKKIREAAPIQAVEKPKRGRPKMKQVSVKKFIASKRPKEDS